MNKTFDEMLGWTLWQTEGLTAWAEILGNGTKYEKDSVTSFNIKHNWGRLRLFFI